MIRNQSKCIKPLTRTINSAVRSTRKKRKTSMNPIDNSNLGCVSLISCSLAITISVLTGSNYFDEMRSSCTTPEPHILLDAPYFLLTYSFNLTVTHKSFHIYKLFLDCPTDLFYLLVCVYLYNIYRKRMNCFCFPELSGCKFCYRYLLCFLS